MLKRILFDPAFLFLIAINAYCIWYFQNNPNEFNTLVFLYWGQSVLIGIFNFADLLTVRNIIPGSISINDTPVNNSADQKDVLLIFLLCTMAFSILYMVFLF